MIFPCAHFWDTEGMRGFKGEGGRKLTIETAAPDLTARRSGNLLASSMRDLGEPTGEGMGESGPSGRENVFDCEDKIRVRKTYGGGQEK
jgi:hypothetical protein